jgi:hypothetical protein
MILLNTNTLRFLSFLLRFSNNQFDIKKYHFLDFILNILIFYIFLSCLITMFFFINI